MTPSERNYFDKQVEWVLARLPKKILRLFDEIPLHVEDYPSRKIRNQFDLASDEDLCGLFSGISIEDRNNINAALPNTITIYRKGIARLAVDEEGHLDRRELRRQIKITILHEMAHFHGFDEDELERMGYG